MPFFSNNVTLFFYDIFPIFCVLLFCHISQSFYSSLLFFSCPIFFPSDLFISTHFYFPFSVCLWFSNLLRCFLLFTFTPPSKNPSLRTAFLEQIMSCTNTIEMRVVRLCSVFRFVPHSPTRIIIGESRRKYRSVRRSWMTNMRRAYRTPVLFSLFLLSYSHCLSLSICATYILVAPPRRVWGKRDN